MANMHVDLLLFAIGTATLLGFALCFVLPPVWIGDLYSNIKRKLYTALLVLLLVMITGLLYYKIGNLQCFNVYHMNQVRHKKKNSKLIQPLYAKLQRSLVKYELNIPINKQDTELILSFAQAESEANEGLLQNDVQKLLYAVLQAVPGQIRALNLLAISFYKDGSYAKAIQYWQDILQQFEPGMGNMELEMILRKKIIETKLKLDESSKRSS